LLELSYDELERIERHAVESGNNIWRPSSEVGGEPHEEPVEA
jgi:hypothetical protein